MILVDNLIIDKTLFDSADSKENKLLIVIKFLKSYFGVRDTRFKCGSYIYKLVDDKKYHIVTEWMNVSYAYYGFDLDESLPWNAVIPDTNTVYQKIVT